MLSSCEVHKILECADLLWVGKWNLSRLDSVFELHYLVFCILMCAIFAQNWEVEIERSVWESPNKVSSIHSWQRSVFVSRSHTSFVRGRFLLWMCAGSWHQWKLQPFKVSHIDLLFIRYKFLPSALFTFFSKVHVYIAGFCGRPFPFFKGKFIIMVSFRFPCN